MASCFYNPNILTLILLNDKSISNKKINNKQMITMSQLSNELIISKLIE